MEQCGELIGKLSAIGVLTGNVSVDAGLSGTLTIAGSIPSYSGPYVVTPGDAEQIIACEGLLMPQDIIIQPVPSNYGRIAWDGVTLTVS